MQHRRFDPLEIARIRTTYATTRTTLAVIARRYRVSPALISGICSGTYYPDAPGPTSVVPRRRNRAHDEHGWNRPEKAETVSTFPVALGSVVRLRSGGPSMTVTTVRSAGVEVAWIDSHGHRQRDTFPAFAVEVVR